MGLSPSPDELIADPLAYRTVTKTWNIANIFVKYKASCKCEKKPLLDHASLWQESCLKSLALQVHCVLHDYKSLFLWNSGLDESKDSWLTLSSLAWLTTVHSFHPPPLLMGSIFFFFCHLKCHFGNEFFPRGYIKVPLLVGNLLPSKAHYLNYCSSLAVLVPLVAVRCDDIFRSLKASWEWSC